MFPNNSTLSQVVEEYSAWKETIEDQIHKKAIRHIIILQMATIQIQTMSVPPMTKY